MGASHATLSSADEQDGMDLLQYAVEQRLYPGSGRMMHTYRLKHLTTDAVVVAKTMWVSQEHEDLLKKREEELLRIKKALQGQPHVSPFLFWHVGEYKAGGLRPVHMLRPHVYTTLSDRLASRPFLTHVEKLWIVHQILGALQVMHDAGVVHGFLTTENVGLTSWNWVLLLDISSYKARTALPDDDPSEYLYYFHELNKHGTDMTTREKRCYIAPERFYTPSRGAPEQQSLTPSMDMFSAGCVVMETFLNGERAMDLGDLMEYRRRGSVVPQKLNKIESSSLRAACRHMLHLDPAKRLSAKEYRDRLEVPETFETVLTPLFERVTCEVLTPDARMAIAASFYGKVLRGTVSVYDKEGESYFHKILGPSMDHACESDTKRATDNEKPPIEILSEIGNRQEDQLLAETEALLKKLESPTFDDDEPLSVMPLSSNQSRIPKGEVASPSSPEAASSLLIYLQLVLSTVRNVQRPSSKLVGLQLLERLGTYSSDDTKLQRIVPTAISLLHDQDPLVRASAVHVMTSTLFTITTFSPSDSNIFPQYIFKRVAHLVSDPSLVVRIAFARCIASLADTAHRFLDISHAVHLYEAVGEDSTTEMSGKAEGSVTPGVFTDDVANLLGAKGEERKTGDSLDEADSPSKGHSRKSSLGNASVTTSAVAHTLISSTYTAELASLHEIVSRWVVHVTTDQSDQSSPPKRSLLHDLARLCNFFGRDGVMAFILPQILAFLNDRRDWQLRAALFECLPSVCSIIGRAATEHFVLPCLETALVDAEDLVMSRALLCLSSLIEMGLLSRSVLVTPQTFLPPTVIPGKLNRGLFEKYLPLLLYPSPSVRRSAVALVNASCRALGFPDRLVFLLPLLRPYLRFEPSSNHLTTPDGLERCLIAPWTRSKLNDELKRLSEQSQDNQLGSQWTSIDDDLRETQDTKATFIDGTHPHRWEYSSLTRPTLSEQKTDSVSNAGDPPSKSVLNNHMIDYLTMLLRSRGTNAFGADKVDKLDASIEGSLKLARHVKFPNQNVAGTTDVSIPSWYSSLHDIADNDQLAPESCAIRSVSSLSQVYGLSVIEDPTLVDSRVSKDTVIVGKKTDESPKEEITQPNFYVDSMLRSTEAKIIQGANAGEWGSETLVDATIADTALLVSTLNGLKVPPLPPNLGVVNDSDRLTSTYGRDAGSDSSVTNEWRPRADTLIATSSFANGHNGPVSRLAVAPDEQYFVSGSYDGTVRVWESRQARDSDGILVSSATYSGHSDGCEQRRPRINDVTALENTNSVASGASDGSLHVWRVDLISTSGRSRVSGSSIIRRIDPKEGEIHAVSHFNTPSASIIMFATQGIVHSMDLRQPREPFKLKHQPDIGFLTSMALGGDRHWMITGTNRGFIALWDIRFQQKVTLWQHPNAFPVTRLATSFTALPKKWGGWSASDTDRRPVMFVACGQNECGMFDVLSGSCRQCFRVIGSRSTTLEPSTDLDLSAKVSSLREVNLSSSRKLFRLDDFSMTIPHSSKRGPSINAMVGNVGGSDLNGLITGGDDGYIRYWDFSTPAKCFLVSGHGGFHHRPTYERVDVDGQRLMLCRQAPVPRHSEVDSSRIPRMVERGPCQTENRHQDSVQDIKILSFPEKLLVSCSRDSTVKLWR